MNTKTHSSLLTTAHGCKPTVARVESRWPQFSGVLLSIPATRKMIESQNNGAAQKFNGMIDYSGEVLELGLDRK
jgi:hypothetical protein